MSPPVGIAVDTIIEQEHWLRVVQNLSREIVSLQAMERRLHAAVAPGSLCCHSIFFNSIRSHVLTSLMLFHHRYPMLFYPMCSLLFFSFSYPNYSVLTLGTLFSYIIDS